MKLIFVCIILSCAVFSVRGACDLLDCTSTGTCAGYAAYKTCLEDLLPGCTSSATDLVKKPLIETAISATDALIAQCGASSASVSMVTLLLAAAVAYFKS